MCVYSAYHTLPLHVSGILIQSSVYLYVKMEKVERLWGKNLLIKSLESEGSGFGEETYVKCCHMYVKFLRSYNTKTTAVSTDHTLPALGGMLLHRI